TINNIRTKYELISKVCTALETDSNELKNILENDHQLEKLKLNSDNIISIFIPNTYQFFWNTSAKDFFDRMINESDKFWNRSRIEKLHKLKLSKAQVITIASIVEKESNYLPERPSIASVYLNRIRKGMKLQADPTVVYAVGDFTINRVLDVHLKKDSPYNTYMYEGLPPGPICIPSANAIDAVLKNEKTSYIYFCAKEDFSGRHNFATTDAQHSINANKFRKALNKRKIYK
ncbi:MAG: endolytic transglycosylase MltG, partial [Bacteroidota bacterium]